MSAKIILGAIIIALIGYWGFTFQVDEREKVIKLQFLEIKDANIEPGIHFKWPFVNKIQRNDGRILTLDVPPTEFPTSEKKYVKVDFFAKWKIIDVEEYFKATRGLQDRANQRLQPILV